MELATLQFDTYKAVNLLKEQGYSKKQAEGFIHVMQEVTLSGVATKQDVQAVKEDVQNVEIKVSGLEVKIAELETKMVKGLADNVKFQLIQTIAIIGVMVALLKFFPT